MEQLILSELCSALDTNILDLDLQASFIQNGGDSLAAAAFASRCEARGIPYYKQINPHESFHQRMY